MAEQVIDFDLGSVRGLQGATGATGATGAAGAAATVEVGTVTSTAYGNPAQVTNSGTDTAAVLDFVIPQGAPGEEVTDLSNLSIGSITTQTAQYPTPQIGDTGATLVGKIIKYFSDIRTLIATKLDAANVVNNFTTTESGYALDARAGKTLNDDLNSKYNLIRHQITNYDITGGRFDAKSDEELKAAITSIFDRASISTASFGYSVLRTLDNASTELLPKAIFSCYVGRTGTAYGSMILTSQHIHNIYVIRRLEGAYYVEQIQGAQHASWTVS